MPARPDAARSGASSLWYWRASAPPAVGQTPTVAFTASGGTVLLAASALSPMWSPLLGAISALSADRQTLTLSNVLPSTASAASGDWGDAWVAGLGGYTPCRVIQVVPGQATTTVTLSEPLPREVDVSAATLIPAWYSRRLTAADVTASVQRGVVWVVSYAPYGGGPDAAYVQSVTDTGILDVVRQPFDTGLSTEDLVSLLDPGGSRVPARAQGYEGAIRAAYEEMVATLRADSPQGLDQHDLSGPELRPVHRFIAAAYLARTADERTEYRARAAVLWDRIRLTCWRNAARNGLATDAERAHPITWVGGTFSPSTAARRTWEDID